MNFRKTLIISLCAGLLSLSMAAAENVTLNHHDDISNGLISFSQNLLVTVPEAATQQNVWADSYIGKLFPSLIPHAGIGASVGGTMLNMTGFKTAAEAIQEDYLSVSQELGQQIVDETGTYVNIPGLNFGIIPDKFVLPSASFDARLGGILLPFDVGLCAIVTNPGFADFNTQDFFGSLLRLSKPWNFDMLGLNTTVDYLTLGADLRLKILQEGTYIPGLSIGGGYYYTRGYFAFNASNSTTLSGEGESAVTQSTSAGFDVSYESKVAFLQLQLCKKISGTTIFVGGRGLLSSTTANWSWNYSTENSADSSKNKSDSDSGTVQTVDGINTALGVFQTGNFAEIIGHIQPQVYAGFGFNFTVLQITASACADIKSIFDRQNYSDFIWSGALSVHVKI